MAENPMSNDKFLLNSVPDVIGLSNRHGSYKDNEKAACTSRPMGDLQWNPFQGNNIQVNKASGHKSSHTRPYIVFVRNRKLVIGLRRLSRGTLATRTPGIHGGCTGRLTVRGGKTSLSFISGHPLANVP